MEGGRDGEQYAAKCGSRYCTDVCRPLETRGLLSGKLYPQTSRLAPIENWLGCWSNTPGNGGVKASFNSRMAGSRCLGDDVQDRDAFG